MPIAHDLDKQRYSCVGAVLKYVRSFLREDLTLVGSLASTAMQLHINNLDTIGGSRHMTEASRYAS